MVLEVSVFFYGLKKRLVLFYYVTNAECSAGIHNFLAELLSWRAFKGSKSNHFEVRNVILFPPRLDAERSIRQALFPVAAYLLFQR